MGTTWNPGWKPRGDSKLRAEVAMQFFIDLKNEGLLPIKNRTVFYHLVVKHLIDKTENGYEVVNKLLTNMRSAGWIPPTGYLLDVGATPPEAWWYSGPDHVKDLTQSIVNGYTIDRQTGQDWRMLFWLESSGHMMAVKSVADRYSISVVTNSRQDSFSLKADVARYILESGSKTMICHIGDYDGQGLNIFETIENDIPELVYGWNAMHGTAYETPSVFATRLALKDLGQVRALGLEEALGIAKPTDMNRKYGITQTCEADAIPPQVVRDMALDAIATNLNRSAYAGMLLQERQQRRSLKEWVRKAA